MKRTLVCLAILLSISLPADARQSVSDPVELTLHPAKVVEPAETCRLLPSADRQTDADAVPLYEKAIQSMPKGVNQTQIREWLNLPPGQFPLQEAEDVVQKHLESLKLAAQAARCKNCNWPEWKPGTDPPDMNGYRELTSVIRLWARLEICRGQYKEALTAMQTAFGVARHLGQAPTILQTLIGAMTGGLTCREIEQFVQGKDSPNLCAALADLPEPLVDVEKAIENELKNHKDYNNQEREQLRPDLDRVRSIAKRMDNHLNELQVVEAIRHYAATHEGQLPQALSDIKDMEVPNDLVGGKAFEYRRTATGATLRAAIPKGGNERDTVHYDIVLRK